MRLTQCLILVCVTIGMAGLGWSQAPDTEPTIQASDTEHTVIRVGLTSAYPMVNGRWWLQVPKDMKLGYVTAWNESTHEPEKNLAPQATFGDIVQAADEFYSHPENRPIPVSWALRIVNMKARGVSAECVEATIEIQRVATAGNNTRTPADQPALARVKRLCGEPAAVKAPAR